MKVLYCDCYSGISGDMFLAAMLDAGFPLEKLENTYARVKIPEYHSVSFQKVLKGAISAGQIQFDFSVPDHDHQHKHSHHHRSFAEIRDLINQSDLSENVISKSQQIFLKIAQAEAAVHNVAVDDVHFHEVGATDSILDVIGAAAALDYFGIEKVYSSPLPLGSGEVNTQHGLLPVPAPATALLLNEMNAVIKPSQATIELVTPTGAGILAPFASFEFPAMKMLHIGTGAGKADLSYPNVMRVMIGETQDKPETCVELSANLDDMTPEQMGAVMNRLLEAGALDVFFTPVQMKKNRPASMLTVIANTLDEQKLSDVILHHTTTLGVRVHDVRRHKAERKITILETEFGPVRVKEKELNGKVVSIHPEFDDCDRISRETGLSIIEIQQRILKNQ